MEKPSEFFIGVMDLFGILLPGMVATMLLEKTLVYWKVTSLLATPTADTVQWATFLVTSYCLGHLIFQAGSRLEDRYEESRKPWDATDEESPYKAAEALWSNALTEDAERKSINTFQWARSELLMKFPAAAQDVHRLEADSKFFRSLFLVSVIAIPFLLTSDGLVTALLAALLAMVCPRLYRKRREKALKQACIHVITLHHAAERGKEAKPT